MSSLFGRAYGLRVSRRGQTTAEYAIIVALVAILSIAAILVFGDQIRALFAASTEHLQGEDQKVLEEQDASGVTNKNIRDDF